MEASEKTQVPISPGRCLDGETVSDKQSAAKRCVEVSKERPGEAFNEEQSLQQNRTDYLGTAQGEQLFKPGKQLANKMGLFLFQSVQQQKV